MSDCNCRRALWSGLRYTTAEARLRPAKENLDSYQVADSQFATVYMLQKLT